MDKRLRREQNISSSESHGDDGDKVERSSELFKSEEPKEWTASHQGKRSNNPEPRGHHQQRKDNNKDSERIDYGRQKHSRLRELLNSFQDDVIQVRETDNTTSDVTTDALPIPMPDQVGYSRQFTRMSPHKLAGTKHSKWKKAVRLSRTVMTMNRSGEAPSGGPPAPDTTEEYSTASQHRHLLGFFRCLDHGSSICSGILVGLLLWSTINETWTGGAAQIIATEIHINIFFTVTVVLTYVTLLGFLIRLYSSWKKISALTVVYALAFLCVLVLHYVIKGYSLLQLECDIYNGLDNERKHLVSKAYNCAAQVRDGKGWSRQDRLLLIIFSAVQTLGSLVVALYFHFTNFVEPWLSPGYKIESRKIMRP